MGTCISADNKSDSRNPSAQLKMVRYANSCRQTSSKETCEKLSPQSTRLAQVKAKLQPLKKGAEQRKKIMSMCPNLSGLKSQNQGCAKQAKQLQNGQNKIFQIKLNKKLQLSRSELFRQTMASMSTSDNNTNEDFRSQSADLRCKKCSSQLEQLKYPKLKSDKKQHSSCKECTTRVKFRKDGKENVLSEPNGANHK